MHQLIECEEKFFCNPSPLLFHFIEKELHFNFQKKVNEIDIYFKDTNLKYLQENTCLRLRKTNAPFYELTSKRILDNDIRKKIEKTFFIRKEKEERLITLLNRIGIESYCTVFKERFIYTKNKDDITYNIMIDKLSNQYSFIELELVAKKEYTLNLSNKLDKFIQLFEKFDLQKAEQNYRDFAKNHIFQSVKK